MSYFILQGRIQILFPKKAIHHWIQKKNLRKIRQFYYNNKNVSWAANQHIRIISEGLCDNEDWSNDAENSAQE